jgi:hypothetical protein
MDVDVFAGRDRLTGKTDHLAVSTHRFAGWNLSQCYFVTSRDGLAHRDSSVSVLQGGICLQVGFGDGYIIVRVEVYGHLLEWYDTRVGFSGIHLLTSWIVQY